MALSYTLSGLRLYFHEVVQRQIHKLHPQEWMVLLSTKKKKDPSLAEMHVFQKYLLNC